MNCEPQYAAGLATGWALGTLRRIADDPDVGDARLAAILNRAVSDLESYTVARGEHDPVFRSLATATADALAKVPEVSR